MGEWLQVLTNPGNLLDILVILIPIVVGIYLVMKFVAPKRPIIGIGLAAGLGIFGGWLVKRKLQHAFDVEDKIAEFKEDIANFKDKQKTRSQAVLANDQIIKGLEQQRAGLAKDAKKHKTELDLIDKELEERKKLNEELLSSSSQVLADTEARSEARRARSASREALLRTFAEESDTPTPMPPGDGGVSVANITIDGHQLQQA